MEEDKEADILPYEQSPSTALQEQIHKKEDIIKAMEEELHDCRVQLTAYKDAIQELQQRVRGMERTILELQQDNPHKMHMKPLLGDLSSKSADNDQPQLQEVCGATDTNDAQLLFTNEDENVPSIPPPALIVKSTSVAPCKLYKGSSSQYLNKAYFAPSGSSKILLYDINSSEWTTLPECPQSCFALAVINGLLTAVGGEELHSLPTNRLISYLEDKECDVSLSQWLQYYPPMPTKRVFPSAVCHGDSLVVVGGETKWVLGNLITVEVMNTETLQWFAASSLPQPVRGASAVISRDTLYLLGGWDDMGSSVLGCSIPRLLSSLVATNRRYQKSFPKQPCSCAWHTIANAPVYQSTCAVIGNELVAIGGRGSRGSMTGTIHMYDPVSDSWRSAGEMSFARYHCLAASLPDCLVAVGGLLKGGYATDLAEIIVFDPELKQPV